MFKSSKERFIRRGSQVQEGKMGGYVNLYAEQVVFFYCVFKEFVGNPYTSNHLDHRGLQLNFEMSRATSQLCEAQAT